MKTINISSIFGRVARQSIAAASMLAFKGYWHYQFNRAANRKQSAAQAQEIMMQTVFEGVHIADAMFDQSDRKVSLEFQFMGKKSFLSVFESKKDQFLRNGQGVVYVHGLLEGISQSLDSNDFLEAALNLCLHKKLGDALLDLKGTAFDALVNKTNPNMESAYLLAVMEAYPLMKEIYEDHHALTEKVRSILDQAMLSKTLPDVLKEQLRKGYAQYSPEPSLKLIS